MPEETSTATTTETPVQAAPATTPEATVATPETPEAAADDSPEPSLIDDVKEAREAEEAKAKPEAKPKAEKPEDKPEVKTGDEKEPEDLTPAEKNRAAWIKSQRDAQLQEAAKIADERKALDAEKAELEKAKSEIAAKQTEKPKEEKVDQPTAELENFKPITLTSYDDGDNENEQALKTGIEALAKDVQALQTAKAEIEVLKSDLKRLMDLAAPFIPDEHGVTQAEVQGAAQLLRSEAEKASESLMAQYGPDSGLNVDPVSLIAALKEYGQGFVNIGEIKPDTLLSQESLLHCWNHANKGKLEELKAAPAKPKEEKVVPPPVRKSEGKPAQPIAYEDMTEREKTLYDIQEAATLNGKR